MKCRHSKCAISFDKKLVTLFGLTWVRLPLAAAIGSKRPLVGYYINVNVFST